MQIPFPPVCSGRRARIVVIHIETFACTAPHDGCVLAVTQILGVPRRALSRTSLGHGEVVSGVSRMNNHAGHLSPNAS
eukprot:1179942-Prorocentrum_minimum.AAC.2